MVFDPCDNRVDETGAVRFSFETRLNENSEVQRGLSITEQEFEDLLSSAWRSFSDCKNKVINQVTAR